METAGITEEPVDPRDVDVLLGKSKECYNHPGNMCFRQVIASSIHLYLQSNSRPGKSTVIGNIIDNIMDGGGGRFLRNLKVYGKAGWHPVDRKAAREKVGHAIRDAIAARKGQGAPGPNDNLVRLYGDRHKFYFNWKGMATKVDTEEIPHKGKIPHKKQTSHKEQILHKEDLSISESIFSDEEDHEDYDKEEMPAPPTPGTVSPFEKQVNERASSGLVLDLTTEPSPSRPVTTAVHKKRATKELHIHKKARRVPDLATLPPQSAHVHKKSKLGHSVAGAASRSLVIKAVTPDSDLSPHPDQEHPDTCSEADLHDLDGEVIRLFAAHRDNRSPAPFRRSPAQMSPQRPDHARALVANISQHEPRGISRNFPAQIHGANAIPNGTHLTPQHGHMWNELSNELTDFQLPEYQVNMLLMAGLREESTQAVLRNRFSVE